MEIDSQPNIASFVIRIVCETEEHPANTLTYRGAIRHIQTDEEHVFTQWEGAVSFIKNFVPIESMSTEEHNKE